MEYIAHKREKTGEEQTVLAHCRETAEIAAGFAEKLNLSHVAELQGLLHDVGKLCADFTAYIRGDTSFRKGEIDHSYAGAKYLRELASKYNDSKMTKTACLIARTIISHHGLHDWLKENGDDYFAERIAKKDRYAEICGAVSEIIDLPSLQAQLEQATREYVSMSKKILNMAKRNGTTNDPTEEFCFYSGLTERVLESILMDADRINTADFMSGVLEERNERRTEAVWEEMHHRIEERCEEFRKKTDPISKQRMSISDRCAAFADHTVGICRLVVPTGGGKTLSSLRFAIEYCQKHSMEKIFYIAPFMSILEQNSDVICKIAGSDNFLEHHSNMLQEIEDGEELKEYQLRTERWDVPVIATTMVQFLNTLFSGQSSCVRRMHRLCKAVILVDEVQAIPMKCIHLFNLAMNYLAHACGSAVVLCSATQPCLEEVAHPLQLDTRDSMTEDVTADFEAFRRTRMISALRPNGYILDEAGDFCCERYLENGNLLVVVNTKSAATAMFQRISDKNQMEWNNEATIIHLSTNMCPAHRRKKIADMKEMLASQQKVICVTTQLIEAGVDISFRCVVRSLAGLDHAAQAAGRCNRNGEYDCCNVYIIDIVDEKLGMLREIQQEQNVTREIIQTERYADLLELDAMDGYFHKLYAEQEKMLSYPVKDLEVDTTLIDLLACDNNRRMNSKELSCQAFQTAGRLFEVISQKTIDVLVPFDEAAKNLILDLNGHLTPDETVKLLRQAQKYAVGIYRHALEELRGKGAIVELAVGVLALAEGFYCDEYGVNINGSCLFHNVL